MMEHLIHPFRFFAESYLATLVIAAGCAYLGIFVALRRIVFIGIALAEISAAGIACAFLAGALVPSLGALGDKTLKTLGAVLFSLAGTAALAVPVAERRIPKESIVAAGYAFGASAAVLVVWKSAADLEHVKNILAGSSLYVTRARLAGIALAAALLAAVHLALAKEMAFVSFDRVMAKTLGLPVRAIDAALLGTIGLAIGVALPTVGVLPVFGFLTIPAAEGLLLAGSLRGALGHAVAQAAIASALGLFLADRLDLPPAPATVAVQIALLMPAGLAARIPALRRAWIVIEVLGVVLALALAAVALDATIRLHGEPRLEAAIPHPHEEPPPHALEAGHEHDGSHAGRIHGAIERIERGEEAGIPILLEEIASDASRFDRGEAIDALRAVAGADLGYDADRTARENAAAIERWHAWWTHQRGRLRYDARARTLRAAGP